jgi:hypothetical protein
MIKINNFNNNQNYNFSNSVKQFELKEAKSRMGNYQAQAQLQGTQELRNQEFKQIQNYQNSQGNNLNFKNQNEQLKFSNVLSNGVNNHQSAMNNTNFLNNQHQFTNSIPNINNFK